MTEDPESFLVFQVSCTVKIDFLQRNISMISAAARDGWTARLCGANPNRPPPAGRPIPFCDCKITTIPRHGKIFPRKFSKKFHRLPRRFAQRTVGQRLASERIFRVYGLREAELGKEARFFPPALSLIPIHPDPVKGQEDGEIGMVYI